MAVATERLYLCRQIRIVLRHNILQLCRCNLLQHSLSRLLTFVDIHVRQRCRRLSTSCGNKCKRQQHSAACVLPTPCLTMGSLYDESLCEESLCSIICISSMQSQRFQVERPPSNSAQTHSSRERSIASAPESLPFRRSSTIIH